MHVLALHIHVQHTRCVQAMFDIVPSLSNVFCSSSKAKFLSVSADGERNMTGRYTGAVTKLEDLALPGFFRTWCVARQLELVIQFCVQQVLTSGFYSVPTGLIGYLRRQKSLISEMRCTCLEKLHTLDGSLCNSSAWLLKHRMAVLPYLMDRNATCAPSSGWWVLLNWALSTSS